MKFYKEHQINPASSCLPLLAQIPIFFALYFVLRDFDEEIYPKYPAGRRSTGSGSSRTSPGTSPTGRARAARGLRGEPGRVDVVHADGDDRGRRSANPRAAVRLRDLHHHPAGRPEFPVGLLLYWLTTNLWTVGQGIVTRRLRAPAAVPPAKRSSRTPPKERAADVTGNGSRRADKERRGAAAAGQAQEEARTEMTARLWVESEGETVGEAKWAALRELEQAHPGIDKSSVRFQVVIGR